MTGSTLHYDRQAQTSLRARLLASPRQVHLRQDYGLTNRPGPDERDQSSAPTSCFIRLTRLRKATPRQATFGQIQPTPWANASTKYLYTTYALSAIPITEKVKWVIMNFAAMQLKKHFQKNSMHEKSWLTFGYLLLSQDILMDFRMKSPGFFNIFRNHFTIRNSKINIIELLAIFKNFIV